jgi:hypothetical protein
MSEQAGWDIVSGVGLTALGCMSFPRPAAGSR